jgi:hypothetical protein
MSDELKVYKYQLTGQDNNHLSADVPAGANIIHADMQNSIPCIWAVVDPTARLETLYFTFTGTGFDVPPDSIHVGTMFQGPYVWHLFQEYLVEVDVD